MTSLNFRLIVCFLPLLGSAIHFAADAQTLYKSIGADGKVHYSDRPNAEGRIEKTMEVESLPSNQVPGLTHSYVEQLRELEKWQADRAQKNPGAQGPVRNGTLLFSATWCGYCKMAKAYMAQHGIAFQEIDVDTPAGRAEFKRVRMGSGGIPLLVASDKKLVGFTRAGYDAFFAQLKLPGAGK